MTASRPWGTIHATKGGVTTPITLHHGQNSLGEPNVFAGKKPGRGKKEFAFLRGYPLYAIQTALVARGYTYKVDE